MKNTWWISKPIIKIRTDLHLLEFISVIFYKSTTIIRIPDH